MNRSARALLLVGVVLTMSGCPCQPSTAHVMPNIVAVVLPLAIRTHSSTSLSATEATQVASDATAVVTNGSGSAGDVACPVHFTVESQDGFVTGDGIVNSGFDYNALFSSTALPTLTGFTEPAGAPMTRQVRVISEIRWCGAIVASSIAGCSDEPGLRMVVVRRGSDREGILWAHEAGHTRGLSHRSDSLLALMYETILPGHDQLEASECTKYRQ